MRTRIAKIPNILVIGLIASFITACRKDSEPETIQPSEQAAKSQPATEQEYRRKAKSQQYQDYRNQSTRYVTNFFDCRFHGALSAELEDRYRTSGKQRDFAQALNEHRLAYYMAREDAKHSDTKCDTEAIRLHEIELMTQHKEVVGDITPENAVKYLDNTMNFFDATIAVLGPVIIVEADLLQDHRGPDGSAGYGLDQDMVEDFRDYINRLFLIAYGREEIIQPDGNRLVPAGSSYTDAENGLRNFGIAVDKTALLINRQNESIMPVRAAETMEQAEVLYSTAHLVPGIKYILSHRPPSSTPR
ncbi:MAG: hypothetical protein C5B50_05255 [Verrucomicrobia bacterium]|nr:MAG: hypothetical protein C5B50_05255 [Verrucomicrobiota bacterium]